MPESPLAGRSRTRLHTILALGLAFILVSACNASDKSGALPVYPPGVTNDAITIGSSLALEGHAGYLGSQILHGALSFISHVNDQGGINGRRIKLISYDDGYDPPRCMVNTQKLIVEDNVFALFNYVGTPTTVKIIPIVTEARIPLVGMFTGASALRQPLNRYLINIRASYYQEIQAAVRYMVNQLNLRKVAVFYQYDAYGFDGLKGTELALKENNLTPVATGAYTRGTLRVEEALTRIMASGAQAVVMIGTYGPCAEFIHLARKRGYAGIFHNVSFVGPDELARRLNREEKGVIVTQVVPPPEPSSGGGKLWGVEEYLKLLKQYYPDDSPNFVSLEGYINARVLVEGLKRVGRDISREGFIDGLESIQNYDLGIANPLSFSPVDHQGLEKVYFTIIRNGKFVLTDETGITGLY
ncbi:MAG: ABC transporter substrate-binding protein [Proteobacteria bacterium]|nr:ABC transporter substrate-binding protein [Pseudomonadota bacterium]